MFYNNIEQLHDNMIFDEKNPLPKMNRQISTVRAEVEKAFGNEIRFGSMFQTQWYRKCMAYLRFTNQTKQNSSSWQLYIKKFNRFRRKIKNITIEEDELMVLFDVMALFPSIRVTEFLA